MPAPRIMKELKLKDGRIAKVSFLSERDSTRELQRYINALIAEKTYLLHNKKQTLKQEEEWKKGELEAFRKKEGYYLVARVGGKIAGSSTARREKFKARGNVYLGISIAKPFRRIGLGEALLRLNIQMAKRLLKPKNIYLSVFKLNKPAYALYKKLGFKEFAVFPKWLLHEGKYVDWVYLKL